MTYLKTDDRKDRTPGVFLPYQEKWFKDDAPVKFWEKARRIGASWAEAAEDCITAASESGSDVWYVGYNFDMAREFIEDCADWARYFNMAASKIEETFFKNDDESKSIYTFRIVFDSGFKITALSSRPANLRGKKGKIVIDEAAFHEDLPGLLKAAMAFLVWGGRVVVLSTHFGADNYFNEIIQDSLAGKYPYSVHRTTFDDAIDQGLYNRICIRTGKRWSAEGQEIWRDEIRTSYGDDAEEELDCIQSKSGGVFLTRVLIESCMKNRTILTIKYDDAFTQKPDWERRSETQAWIDDYLKPQIESISTGRLNHSPCFIGADFGRSGDLSVFWPVQEQEDLHLNTPFTVELRNVPFEEQKQIFFYMCDQLPLFSGAALDARGNGQWLAEVTAQKYGIIRIMQIMLTIALYREIMPRYKAHFTDKTITIPASRDVLNDHRALKMIDGVAKIPAGKKNKGADKGQRHGDSAIAGALACHAAYSLTGSKAIPKVMAGDHRETVDNLSNFMNRINYSSY